LNWNVLWRTAESRRTRAPMWTIYPSREIHIEGGRRLRRCSIAINPLRAAKFDSWHPARSGASANAVQILRFKTAILVLIRVDLVRFGFRCPVRSRFSGEEESEEPIFGFFTPKVTPFDSHAHLPNHPAPQHS
jgi:hypothetical protein